MNRFNSEKEILDLSRAFEAAAVARDDWKHAEHLAVALIYVSNHGLETATARMRSGIFSLLKAFKVDPVAEMPYHETLTVFWMQTVAEFNASANETSLLNKTNELIGKYDKDYPLKFYSRERLFSDEARTRFVVGDL